MATQGGGGEFRASILLAMLHIFAPTLFCRSWAPWARLISTGVVVIVVVLIVRVMLGHLPVWTV